VVEQRVVAQRREHPQRHAEQHRQRACHQAELDGHAQPLPEEFLHAVARIAEAGTEIAVQQPAEIGRELQRQWPVQAVARVQIGQHLRRQLTPLRRGLIPGPARRQVHQREGQQRDEE
jgi:hypothetical protein